MITANRLLSLLATVVARYPTADVKSVLMWPNHLLMFTVNDVVVAQICVETGEITVK